LNSARLTAAQPTLNASLQAIGVTAADGANAPGVNSQGSTVQSSAALRASQSEPAPTTDTTAQSPTPNADTSVTSSQGGEAQPPAVPGAPLDERVLSPNVTAQYYHVPGSVLMPVDSSTTLAYDYMGCVHAKTGGANLLNAPLDIPSGSTLTGMRLYYVDSNASANVQAWITRYDMDGTTFDDIINIASSGSSGRGNVWGDVDPAMGVLDTYSWSYVLNVRVNSASNTLQICGLRVMYYPPAGCCNYLPAVMRTAQP
jgi:hypothetical protein